LPEVFRGAGEALPARTAVPFFLLNPGSSMGESQAIYLTMCLLALWWLISALRDGLPTRRTLSRHSMLLMLFWFLPGTFKLFSI
jgi:hypothetical protein